MDRELKLLLSVRGLESEDIYNPDEAAKDISDVRISVTQFRGHHLKMQDTLDRTWIFGMVIQYIINIGLVTVFARLSVSKMSCFATVGIMATAGLVCLVSSYLVLTRNLTTFRTVKTSIMALDTSRISLQEDIEKKVITYGKYVSDDARFTVRWLLSFIEELQLAHVSQIYKWYPLTLSCLFFSVMASACVTTVITFLDYGKHEK